MSSGRIERRFKWEQLSCPLPDSVKNKDYGVQTVTTVGSVYYALCLLGRDGGIACMGFDVHSREWIFAKELPIQKNLLVRQAILIDDFILFWAKETYYFAREALRGYALFKLDLVTFEASKVPVFARPFQSEFEFGALVGAPVANKRQIVFLESNVPSEVFVYDVETGLSSLNRPSGGVPTKHDYCCSISRRTGVDLFFFGNGEGETRGWYGLYTLQFLLNTQACQWSNLKFSLNLKISSSSTISYFDGCIIVYGKDESMKTSQVLLYEIANNSFHDMKDSERYSLETEGEIPARDLTKAAEYSEGVLFFGGYETYPTEISVLSRRL